MPSFRRAVDFDQHDVTSTTSFVRCVSTDEEALAVALLRECGYAAKTL